MEKRCFKCLCVKPFDAFYKHGSMKGGRVNKCIECTKEDVQRNRIENIERIRAYDRMRGSMPHRVAARKEYQATTAYNKSHSESVDRYRKANAYKANARNLLAKAVRRGKLKPWPVCAVPDCDKKPEAHHPDYSTPLEVVWLCDGHHKEVHKMSREVNRVASTQHQGDTVEHALDA